MTAVARAGRSIVARWLEEESLSPAIGPAIEDELVSAHARSQLVVLDDSSLGSAVAVLDGAKAWTLGAVALDDPTSLLRGLGAACARQGARRLWSAGPPRWYLRSGVSADTAEDRAWRAIGGVERSRHLDLWVSAEAAAATGEPVVERVQTVDELTEVERWVRADFSAAWADEVRCAFEQGAVFVARPSGEVAAFAAHSGHCAAAGTFGPLGARASARGKGLGAAVTRAALRDLGERGFERACVPWVDESVARFYERTATVVAKRARVLYAVDLTAG